MEFVSISTIFIRLICAEMENLKPDFYASISNKTVKRPAYE
jgi:hypothetical protein